MSCRVGVSSVWEVLLYDDTSARTITAISSIIIFTIIINSSVMVVLVIIAIIIVIKVIVLIMTRKLRMFTLTL